MSSDCLHHLRISGHSGQQFNQSRLQTAAEEKIDNRSHQNKQRMMVTINVVTVIVSIPKKGNSSSLENQRGLQKAVPLPN